MRNLVERMQILKLRDEGLTYDEISGKLNLKWYDVRNVCHYKLKGIKKKTGPKHKITKAQRVSIKRQISLIQNNHEKVTSLKLIKECQLNANIRTVQYHLRNMGYVYKKINKQIYLSQQHKDERIRKITEWITAGHIWEKTIFSDEKRFCLDGPDDWRSYISKNQNLVRQKRQCNGGGIMIWLMLMPNGLISHKVIKGKFNSDGYIKLLQESIVPMIKLNFGSDVSFQEDNSPVHKARKVKQFMKDSNIEVLDWPPKSPDLNIVEDVWKWISDKVYDGPQFNNCIKLTERINEVIISFNKDERPRVMELYGEIRKRLCKVLQYAGNLYNRLPAK